jgi:hypothetical protein
MTQPPQSGCPGRRLLDFIEQSLTVLVRFTHRGPLLYRPRLGYRAV